MSLLGYARCLLLHDRTLFNRFSQRQGADWPWETPTCLRGVWDTVNRCDNGAAHSHWEERLLGAYLGRSIVDIRRCRMSESLRVQYRRFSINVRLHSKVVES